MITDAPLPFEVHWVAFEFDDIPGVLKHRPVVVLSAGNFDDSIVVLSLKVTSHAPRPEFFGEIALTDWEQAGLSKPSVVRCTKIARLPLTRFSQKTHMRRLSNRDALRICRALSTLGVLTDF